MRRNYAETSIHLRRLHQTPREILINLLEDEGDAVGWDQDELIQETAMRLDGAIEGCLRMAKIALSGLLRDGVVIRDGQLICLKE